MPKKYPRGTGGDVKISDEAVRSSRYNEPNPEGKDKQSDLGALRNIPGGGKTYAEGDRGDLQRKLASDILEGTEMRLQDKGRGWPKEVMDNAHDDFGKAFRK